MSTVYDWSLTAANNSNSDSSIAWSDGMAPSAVDNSSRAMMTRTREFVGDIVGEITAGGSANALTLTARSAFTTYANGIIVSFKAASDNTGATTLTVNAIGTRSVRKVTTAGDEALTGGEIQQDGVYLAHYSTAANGGSGGWLLVNPSLPVSITGTYTPTITAGANVAATNSYTCYYTRTGNQVHVWGLVDIDPTAASTPTTFSISLPIASNFTAVQHLSGIATHRNAVAGGMYADATNDRAICDYTTTANVSNGTFSFFFDYVVL